jgi:DDE superfamily endonuclease
MERIVKWMRELTSPFIDKYLKFRDQRVRIEAAHQKWPALFSQKLGVTLVGDGRHSLVKFDTKQAQTSFQGWKYSNGNKVGALGEKDYYSFKLNKPALNTQILIAADGYIEWVSSKSLPASFCPDIVQIRMDKEQLKKLMGPQDKIAFDGGYFGLEKDLAYVIPHRKHPKKPLSEKLAQQNNEFSEFRGDVERIFGRLATKFDFLTHIYRLEHNLFNIDMKLACAILNCELEGKQNQSTAYSNHALFRYDMCALSKSSSESESESESIPWGEGVPENDQETSSEINHVGQAEEFIEYGIIT